MPFVRNTGAVGRPDIVSPIFGATVFILNQEQEPTLDTITYLENGEAFTVSFAELLKYHGPGFPGGVAHGLKSCSGRFRYWMKDVPSNGVKSVSIRRFRVLVDVMPSNLLPEG